MGIPIASLVQRAAALLVVMVLALSALPARAAGLNAKDQKQIVEVVQAQLQAFAQDDAEKAFSYAAPNIQRMIGNAERFIDMVRSDYRVVYRPASTAFAQPSGAGMEAALAVHMTDEDGSQWVALYGLQKQKNKTWRITGCVLTKPSGTTV